MLLTRNSSPIFSSWLMRLLLAALFLVDLILWRSAAELHLAWPMPIAVFAIGFLFAQAICSAAWLIEGQNRSVVGVLGFVLAIGGGAALFARLADLSYRSAASFLIILTMMSGFIILSYRAWDHLQGTRTCARAQNTRQFSLGQLMALTSGIAILLGLIRWINPEMHRWPAMLMLCLMLCCLSLVPAWLRRKRCKSPLLWGVAILFCCALGLAAPLTGCTPNQTAPMLLCTLAQALTSLFIAHVYSVALFLPGQKNRESNKGAPAKRCHLANGSRTA